MKIMKQGVAYLLIAVTLSLSLSMPARADIVGTEHMLAQDAQATARARVEAFMARDQVAAQLAAWGVPQNMVNERVAALSASELQRLASTIDTQPAGGELLGLIGVIFVVLLILELVGVINIFH